MEIVGVFSNGKTSHTVKAILKPGGADRLTVVSAESGEVLVAAAQFDVNISSRLGSTPRRLEFFDGEAFFTDDNGAIDELVRSREDIGFSSILHTIESQVGLVVVAAILTLLIVWASLTRGIPYLAREVAFQLPQSVQESVGAGSLDILDRLVFEPSALNTEKIASLRSLMNPFLALESSNPRIEFRSGVGPNAFALPDGTVVFTDELIELADDEEEILAILFHEMGHLHHRHILRRTLQDSVITLGVIFVTGDVESANILLGMPALFLDLRYSRDFEIEADRFALETMSSEGIDLSKFERIMNKLDSLTATDEFSSSGATTNSKLLDYLSTHPSTSERIALISEFK